MPGSAFDSVAWGSGKASLLTATDSDAWVAAENANATTQVQSATDTDTWLLADVAVAVLGSGTVATFTAVNRDTLAAAGGETLIATVTGIVGTPANPTINGVTASGLIVVDSTHISFVTPAGTAGGPYSIILGGQTLSNCVTVMAAITTTFATGNFDDSTPGTWSLSDNWISGSGGSHAYSTTFLLPGSTKSLKIIIASGGDSQLHYAFADNRPLLETNGVFLRFWVYMPDATVTALTTGGSSQQKLTLCRKDVNTNPPSWGMVGVGNAFAAKKLTLVRDAGTTTAYSTAFDMGDTQGWTEVQLGMNRKSSTGTLTLWVSGLKVFTETLTSYGSDTSTDIFYPRVGGVFNSVGSTINTYFENVTLANGYIGSNV